MTVSTHASFDASQYITTPDFSTGPATEYGEAIVGLPSQSLPTVGDRAVVFFPGADLPSARTQSPSFGSGLPVVNISLSNRHPELPRGCEWSSFPLILPHEFRPDNAKYLCLFEGSMLPEASFIEVQAAIAGQECMFYDESGLNRYLPIKRLYEARYLVGQHLKALAPGKPILMRAKGETGFKEVDPVSVFDQPAGGWFRYEQSYRFNFKAIGCRAIDHVLNCLPPVPTPCPDAPYRDRLRAEGFGNAQAGYLKHKHTLLCEPYALQILFALREATVTEQVELFDFFEGYQERRGKGPYFSFGKHVENGIWVGSGKYATRLPVIDEVGWVMNDAAVLGFVDMKSDQKVRLTDAGLVFLDIMHADNYDPDAFLRFMNPSTMTIAASEIERIDAWMMRFFRKMKTKVNAL